MSSLRRHPAAIGAAWLAAAALSTLVACSSPTSTADGGGGTGTGNARVEGLALLPSGQPAAGARILLRSSTFVRTTPGTGLGKSQATSADAISGMDGRFSLRGLDAGNYRIEVNSGDTLACLIDYHVDTNAVVALAQVTLLPMARLSGKVADFGVVPASALVSVVGLDRAAQTNDRGEFTVAVPEGSYRIHVESVEHRELDDVGEVEVEHGQERWVGTVTLFANSPGLASDTLIVRALLDTNGLRDSSVASVIELSGGRISELDLARLPIRVVPAGIGGLTGLHELKMSNCGITSLPSSVGRLTGLTELELASNNLISLPVEIAALTKLSECSFAANRLCVVQDSVRAWLDRVDPDWKATQAGCAN